LQYAEKLPQPKGQAAQRQPAATYASAPSRASESPGIRALAQLQAMANRSPRMLAQRERMQALQDAAQAARTVQRQPAPNRTGLPDGLKAGVESLSGLSMDHVRVHYNSAQPAQLKAHAFAQGADIHIAPGQEKHLPHEAWHVVQQAQGRVRPTMQMKGSVAVNDDAGLEREADVMGAKAARTSKQNKGSPVKLSYGGAVQMFAVPQNLTSIKGDVEKVENDLGKVEGNKELPGGEIWAVETRSATLRKLNEFEAYKLSYANKDESLELPKLGENVVTEPDVGQKNDEGYWTNVVENKFVTGQRGRISENVSSAIGQIKLSNRSPNYYGDLFARVELSDATTVDLRDNGNSSGDNKMKNNWSNLLKSGTNWIVEPHKIHLHVINLPDRKTQNGKVNLKLTS